MISLYFHKKNNRKKEKEKKIYRSSITIPLYALAILLGKSCWVAYNAIVKGDAKILY